MPVHGLINARVITLYHLDMVWQQKQTEEQRNHKAIPQGEQSKKPPCGNQGSPQPGSPRSHGAAVKA